MHANAVVVAAGRGTRFGDKLPKQFHPMAGKPLLAHALVPLNAHPRIENIIIVGAEEWLAYIAAEIIEPFGFQKITRIVAGGKERQDSVLAGVQALERPALPVVIHDAARPLVTAELIDRVLDGLQGADACVPGIPSPDTVKQIEASWVQYTLDREKLRLIQTPQAFRAGALLQALQQITAGEQVVTDEATLIERMGGRVRVVEGDRQNFKITTALDFQLAEYIIKERSR